MSQNEKIAIFDYLRHFYATIYATYNMMESWNFVGVESKSPG